MVRDATVQACMDMLFAARAVLADLGIEEDGLFLSGWSQGSWSTQQFRHKLETLNIPVRAAATAATPADLYLLLARWINHPTKLDAAWLAGCPILFIHSYAYYYGMPGLPQTAIKPEYQAATKDFYENKIGWETLQSKIATKIPELLRADFAARSTAGVSVFFDRLRENQAFMKARLSQSSGEEAASAGRLWGNFSTGSLSPVRDDWLTNRSLARKMRMRRRTVHHQWAKRATARRSGGVASYNRRSGLPRRESGAGASPPAANSLCPPRHMFQPIQIASTVALNGPEDCVHEICETYRERRDHLIAGLNRIGWETPSPKATMIF